MSSGEADAFTFTVTSPVTAVSTSNYTNSSSSFYYTYPTIKDRYFYQITCPKCKNLLWAEMDTVVTCKCKSKIKAVSEVVDYEVPVKR